MNEETKVLIKGQVTGLLKQFMAKTLDEKQLVEKLTKICNRYKRKDKNVWFRFFPDDPIATTVRNIEVDLSTPRNRGYIYDNFEIAISNDSLIVNFS